MADDTILIQRPWRWVPSAWLAMGLAYAFVTHVAAVLLRDLGLSTSLAILSVSLLGLPYVIKPIYAPIVELRHTKRIFILVSQIVLAMAFGLIACVVGFRVAGPAIALILLAVIAVAGSVQDIACEGTYLTELDQRRQGLFTGVQSIFWNGAALAGGGALIALSGLRSGGWALALVLCAILYLALAGWHARSLPAAHRPVDDPSGKPRLGSAISSFFRRQRVAQNALFCLCFPLSAGLFDKVEPFFLIDPLAAGGLGFDRDVLGALYLTTGFGGLVAGAAIGSVALTRYGLDRIMVPMGVAVIAPAAIFLALASFTVTSTFVVGAAYLAARASLAFGMIGYVVFLQRAMSPGPFPTTHYNLASGLKALTMMLAGAASGPLQHLVGYRALFAIALLAGLPVLALCRSAFIREATAKAGRAIAALP